MTKMYGLIVRDTRDGRCDVADDLTHDLGAVIKLAEMFEIEPVYKDLLPENIFAIEMADGALSKVYDRNALRRELDKLEQARGEERRAALTDGEREYEDKLTYHELAYKQRKENE